jgi:hypothetical protein
VHLQRIYGDLLTVQKITVRPVFGNTFQFTLIWCCNFEKHVTAAAASNADWQVDDSVTCVLCHSTKPAHALDAM